MSLIPILFDMDPWEMRRAYRNDLDLLGIGITARKMHELMSLSQLTMDAARQSAFELPPPTVDKEGFRVCVDVQQFLPKEITVKTIDNMIVVEGKHEERHDEHGYISRHFVRKYVLPEGYDPRQVISTLSSDRVLTIKAPRPPEVQGNERVVPIQQIGPAQIDLKENSPDSEEVVESKSLENEDDYDEKH